MTTLPVSSSPTIPVTDGASDASATWPSGSPVHRVRHTLRRRTLVAAETTRITPAMIRVTFTGEDLADFASAAPDDHVKLFFSGPSGDVRRDYTPRAFDAGARRLVIDFAVHEAGPATAWACAARPGDALEIAGPRGSAVVAPDVLQWLLIGDETALPAIGRRIEELRAGTRVTSVVAVTGPAEQQMLRTRAEWTALWIHRPAKAAADPVPVLDALVPLDIPPRTFVWIAAEAEVARSVRAYLLNVRRHPIGWTRAAGYWVKGEADAHLKFED